MIILTRDMLIARIKFSEEQIEHWDTLRLSSDQDGVIEFAEEKLSEWISTFWKAEYLLGRIKH